VRRLAESIGLASSLSAADGEERNVLVVDVQHGLAGLQIHLRLTPAACIGAEIQAPFVHQLDLLSPGLMCPLIPLLLKPEAVIGSLSSGDRLRAEQPRREEKSGIASSGDRTNGHQGVAKARCGA
jgi:hypothetical protein